MKLPEMGAIILSYSLLRDIKRRYPSAEIFFVTLGRNREVFDFLDGVIRPENVLTIREDSPFQMIADGWSMLRRLHKEKIDVLFDLEFFSRMTAVFSFLTGARRRIGFHAYAYEGLYRGRLFTHKLLYNPLSHVSRTYLSMAQVADLPSKSTPEVSAAVDEGALTFPKYRSDPATKQKVLDKMQKAGIDTGKRIFLINAEESVLPVREWPVGHFIELSKRLLAENDTHLILIAVEGTERKAKALLEAINDERCVSWARQLTLPELLELFEMAEGLVSNDSSVAHLAMLSSIKKFVFFGPESPQVFAPLGDHTWLFNSNWPCSPCLSAFNNRLSRCADNRCLEAVRPEEVYAKIKDSGLAVS